MVLLIISTCPLKSAISTLVIMKLSQPLQDVWLWRSGDRGFDPLGLAKPNEYLQYDVDEADQNKGKNVQGAALGKYNVPKEAVSVKDPLSPYNEVRCLLSALDFNALTVLTSVIDDALAAAAASSPLSQGHTWLSWHSGTRLSIA